MPAVNSKQRTLACMALAVKEGKLSPTYSKKAKQMADSMNIKQLQDYCHSDISEIAGKEGK